MSRTATCVQCGREFAMRAVLCSMQPKCWPVAKAAIPAVGDWSHEAEIWGAINAAPGYDFLGERTN